MTRRKWLKKEDDYLIYHYQNKTNKDIAKHLKRTENSVKNRARKLGVKKKSHFWGDKEDRIIEKFYGEWGVSKCKEKLPNRSKYSIHKRARELGVRCNLIKQRQNLGLRKHNMPKGFYIDSNGYVVYSPTGKAKDRVYYHRYVMEKHLGRKLSSDEVVHHIDENKENNSIYNLQIMTRSEHAIHHHGDLSNVRESPTPSES